ncbi:MAG TPA: AI-2E family transporter [Elusimicrobiota bacterium]|nr:AI-2E family transporter [Elusimicrobiota bacterium]
MTREQLFRYFVLAVLAFLGYQILKILSPFYAGILGAIVVTLIFYPMHQFILARVIKDRPNPAAVLSTFVVVAFIVFPFLFFTWILLRDMADYFPRIEMLVRSVQNWSHSGGGGSFPWLAKLEGRLQLWSRLPNINLEGLLLPVFKSVMNAGFQIWKMLARNLIVLVINLAVMVFTLFFLFRDGPILLGKIKEVIPMDPRHKDQIAHQLYLTVTAIVRGIFFVAVTQGVLAGLGFLIGGVSSPVLLGFASVFAALIPFIGATIVWLPVGIFCLTQGSVGQGVFILLWGGLVVSLVDNFLRPYLVGTRAKLPILFLFFGILGGIKVYGPTGLFLGPLVVAMLIAFVKIYREMYASKEIPVQK